MALRQLFPENIRSSENDDDLESLEDFMSQVENSENARRELESLLQQEQSNLNVDESIRNQIHLTPDEISLVANDVLNSSEFEDTFDVISSSEIESLREQSDPFRDYIDTIDVVCEECITHTNITRMDQIQPGDHIRFHRANISSGLNIYNHHAIVISVEPDVFNPRVGKLTLVHFTTTEDGRRVIKNTEHYNVVSERIDKIVYPSRPFTSEQIVQRANEMAESFERNPEQYNVFTNNCEHKANKVATGNPVSSQASKFFDYVRSTISWLLKLILKAVIRLFTTMKPLIRGFAHISVFTSLISLIDKVASLKEKLKKGLLCLKCYQMQYSKLMASLVFCLLTVGISVLCHVGWFYFSVTTIVAIALPFVASFLIDNVLSLIQPAAKIPKPLVRLSTMIRPGDVITFPYIGLNHEGVVTRVNYNPENNTQPNVIKAYIVHYNYPGLFGTRTVVKEEFFFNLDSDYVYVYNFGQHETLPPDQVVRNALAKIDEQNFSAFSNRSSHMARKCKTGSSELKDVPYSRASRLTDLSPGDVIDFTYCGLSHQGVLVKVEYPESVQCSVVHYNYAGIWGTREIVEEPFLFNLSKEDLYVHNYTGIEVYDREEVVKRARSRLGEQKFNTFTNRSSHLAEWCKIKKEKSE